tara:strand:- start:1362 stop:1919 length:558 start_codon:yes stop_codon:yes gene_type:complete
MSDYDPSVPMLRQLLALQILGKLKDAGFAHEPPTKKMAKPYMAERVYARVDGLPPGMKVQVYTTVIGDGKNVPIEVRASGKDAIRVCAVYVTKDGMTRGLGKETRVNRTGNIEDIIDRMVERMRKAWMTCKTAQRCHCGAPKFVTKNNKLCCSEICWKSDEEKRADEISFKTKKRRTRRNYRRWR